jgi:hypothetical protein
VFIHQGGVEEESFGQRGLCVSNGLPVGRAEVGAERKTYPDKQVVGKDVGESASLIWMMLDSMKARLEVIGMHGDVVIGI